MNSEMKVVLEKLKKERDRAQYRVGLFENVRAKTPKESPYWRGTNEAVHYCKGEVKGLDAAIAAIVGAIADSKN